MENTIDEDTTSKIEKGAQLPSSPLLNSSSSFFIPPLHREISSSSFFPFSSAYPVHASILPTYLSVPRHRNAIFSLTWLNNLDQNLFLLIDREANILCGLPLSFQSGWSMKWWLHSLIPRLRNYPSLWMNGSALVSKLWWLKRLPLFSLKRRRWVWLWSLWYPELHTANSSTWWPRTLLQWPCSPIPVDLRPHYLPIPKKRSGLSFLITRNQFKTSQWIATWWREKCGVRNSLPLLIRWH